MTETSTRRSEVLLSRRDLDFLLHEWLDVVGLTDRPRFAEHSAETFDALLDLSERLAVERFAPHNREADRNEPRIDDDGRVELVPGVRRAVTAFVDAGLQSAAFDHALGGMQLPLTVQRASSMWFSAANPSTTGYLFLAAAAANLLVAHAGAEIVERFAVPMIEGRIFGTMCLSEPDVGSSLADISTRAERSDDGTYRLRGTKMWISAGDHELGENIVHLVLARTGPAGSGTAGLSLFSVPKWLVGADGARGERNDVVLLGLNHKMGNRGTVNTVLGFGDGTHRPGGLPGAVGHLIGEEGAGLACMFSMMNEARIAVGSGAASLGSAAFLSSLAYARTRLQGRRLDDPDPTSAPVPIVEHPDVRRMLLAQKSYVEGSIALILYCARLVDEQASAPDGTARERAGLLLEILTPIAKSFPSQWCLVATDLAIQVHGGYGYTRDFDVEQHYRDNRLNQIHEGTHGIQGLDLLGRKVPARGGASFAQLAVEIRRTVDAARQRPDLADLAERVGRGIDRLTVTTGLLAGAEDRAAALANASIYLEAAGHVVVAWLWLEQALACGDRTGDFYDAKRAAARYFLIYELPRTSAQFDLLDQLDRTVLDLRPEAL